MYSQLGSRFSNVPFHVAVGEPPSDSCNALSNNLPTHGSPASVPGVSICGVYDTPIRLTPAFLMFHI